MISSKNRASGKLEISCSNIEIFSNRDIKFKYKYYSTASDIVPGKYVLISFKDSGCGIAPENLKKIFEPFFTTKEIGQGTGLGLATVTGIIEQTGGHIYVSSQLDEGTEFLIFLKRHEKSAIEIKNEMEKVERPKDLTGTGTILIVEDEEPVRMFSSRALKNKGYNILEAFSGENALEVIESYGGDKIDLIISDVVMPGISGPEFVEIAVGKYPKIKVIFVSGYGEDAFYQKYGSERKFNFLPKPYSLSQLAEKAKEIINS
jgi:two-component system cell cycle sensor histidine kinase/response regulator CckA